MRGALRMPEREGSSVRMEDIARAAGVSPMTVSNAFQQPAKVRAETRERIYAAADALGYVPNRVAGNLASGRSRFVGAIVPSLRNSNFAGMVQGLQERLEVLDHELLLANADTAERQVGAARVFLGRRVSGLILTGTEHPPGLSAMLRAARLPVVETFSVDGPFIDMAVGFSNYAASRALMALVIEQGYQHVGFAGYAPRDMRFRERQRGFQDALAEAGLRNDLLFFGPEALGFSGGRHALDHLLGIEPRLQALVCVTDIFAVGALFECQRKGWSVPGRFAVVGYGDYEIAAEVPPGLTTVQTRARIIGATAADLLVARGEQRAVPDPIRDIGYQIVRRGSL